jgi:uncharacterized membrane protein YkgB
VASRALLCSLWIQPTRQLQQLTVLVTRLEPKIGLLKEDLDYNLLRTSMVIIFLFFGYTKWHEYAAQALMPFISNGPLIFWLYPAFGVRGATRFLGASEWLIAALLFSGFWNKKLGILGALGSTVTFITTVTIIPLMPNGWAASAGGFPAMVGNVPFLMKDVVLLAVSIYLLRQDVLRVSLTAASCLSSPRMPEEEFSSAGTANLIDRSFKLLGTAGCLSAPMGVLLAVGVQRALLAKYCCARAYPYPSKAEMGMLTR